MAAKTLWDIFQDPELSQLIHIDRELEKEAVDLFWKFEDKKNHQESTADFPPLIT
jgi:hypothetical protein